MCAFYATLWKHYAIRKRQIVLTCFEVIVPILTMAFIVYARSTIPGFSKVYINTTTTAPALDEFSLLSQLGIEDLSIYYAPNNNFTEDLIRRMQLKLNLYNHHIVGFSKEIDLFNYYNTKDNGGTNVAIIFENLGPENVPKRLQYNLKIYKDFVEWDTKDLFSESLVYMPGAGSEKYIQNGFLPIQFAIETSYIEMTTNENLNTKFEFQEFPYPPHTTDSGINEVFTKCLPLVTILSFLFVCSSVLNNIVQEKAQGIKELMKINGLQSWSLFAGWFLNGFLLNLISIIVIVILLKCRLWGVEFAPIEHCHWSILFLLLTLYCSATISFFLLFSTFFHRATLASVVSIVTWLAGFIILTSIGHRALLKLGFKRLFALMPNVALFYAYDVIAAYELREVNLNLNNVFASPTESYEDISMGAMLFYLLFETIFYFIFALYLDQVLPGPYGIPKPVFFIFSKEMLKKSNSVGDVSSASKNSDAIEMLNVDDSNVMIRVRNLTKEYANVTAVKDLTIDIYKGTITSLLGRNGAGKTTTMSMMTGMTNPTSGDVFIDGVSIVKHPEKARKLMSVCPQHDLLFKELTVWQHFILFGLLRGSSKRECETQATNLLNKLKLFGKQNDLVCKLSGGMMRKVALGVALMGNPKLLILDEPTAGIDVEARREIWDLILSYKKTHTILLSTHFLEEADELSDRIAIMDRGILVSYGTSMFLRNKFNVGYICTCVLEDETKKNGVISAIMTHIPEATLLGHDDVMSKVTSKNMVQFVLPNNMKHKFHVLLEQVHNNKRELGIKSVKLSNTTLEDVVLKVMATAHQDQNNVSSKDNVDNSDKIKSNINVTNFDETEKFNLLDVETDTFKKLSTLFKKLFCLAKNHWNFLKKIRVYALLMLCLFFLFGAITMFTSKLGYRNVAKDGTTLLLNLAPYGKTKVYFTVDGDSNERLSDVYRDVVTSVGSIPLFVNDTMKMIVQEGIENIVQYKRWMVAAAEFKLDKNEIKDVKVLFSNNALHGAPISLNMVTNTILKYLTGDMYSISVSNTPLHAAKQSYIEVQQSSSANMLLWTFFLPLGPLLLMSISLIYPSYMYLNEINVLQKLCGIPVWLYWIINYIVDFIFVTAISFILVLLLLCVNFATNHQTFELFEILVIYCVANIPFGYLFTRLKSVETAIFRYFAVSILLGLGLAGALMIAEAVEATSFWTTIFRALVLCVPQASLTYLLGSFSVKVVEVHNWNIKTASELAHSCQYNQMPCCEPSSNECAAWKSAIAFGSDMIVAQLVVALIYFVMVICIDSGIQFDYVFDIIDTKLLSSDSKVNSVELQSVKVTSNDDARKLGKMSHSPSSDKTDNPVLQTSCSSTVNKESGGNLYEVKGISKKFLQLGWWPWKWCWIRPVNNLEFTVAKNQCFGLLGVNGAGKTTTFRILTKATKPSCGTMEYKGTYPRLVMGYCPQKNALIEKFTVLELLEAFANLNGAPVTKEDLLQLLKICGLSDYTHVPSGTLSGGNKRKLNMAIAFVANPELLLLDEPTTGVDLVARRELWRIIDRFKKSCSVILTSHSMEECEALCDEIAVMKNGFIKVRGKIDDLKREFCVGYMIKIEFERMEPEKINDCSEAVLKELKDQFYCCSIEKDTVSGTLQIQVKQSSWEEIFLFMERLKDRNNNKYCILDYFVKEVSFEDVFLRIANNDV